MFSGLRAYLYGAVLAIWAGVSTWLYFKGRQDAKAADNQDRLDAIQDVRETRHELETSDDDRLVDILTGKLR